MSACAASLAAVAAPPVHAAPAPVCARTTDPDTPAAPEPGKPCWVDVTPYPFGVDGDPVDTTRLNCPASPQPQQQTDGYRLECYLTAASMAFRAWNRGLAAMNTSPPSPFGVWYYNGTRWSPDPTFPGRGTCNGTTVLWAGKLDYWLVNSVNWGSLCRFDGSAGAWQPLEVPVDTLTKVPRAGGGLTTPAAGAIHAGSCLSWDNCWFVGDFGTALHWDGVALTDASPGPDRGWLMPNFTAAIARTDAAGAAFGVAAGASGWTIGATALPLPAQPDGSSPAQLYSTAGGPFAPLTFSAPTLPVGDDRWRTDLVAVDADPGRRGWVAGNPATGVTRNSLDVQPAPVVPFALGGGTACTAPEQPLEYQQSDTPNGQASYQWNALSVFQQTGGAVAGGSFRPPAAGASPNDDGRPEPVIAQIDCDGSLRTTRFREPDPTIAGGPPIPADRSAANRSAVAAVAASAVNDAWAATGTGRLKPTRSDPNAPTFLQRPHVYRLTDTARPSAPAGDDDETRPIVVVEDPPIFIEEDPPPEPPAPPAEPPVIQQAPPKTKRVRTKAALYSIKLSKKARHIRGDRYSVTVTFKVRRPVTIGVQGLRKGKVVARSGLKRFTGKHGKLTLVVRRKKWPTAIRFYTKTAEHAR